MTMETAIFRAWIAPVLIIGFLIGAIGYEIYRATNAPPSRVYADDWTPLAKAAKNGDTELVRELIAQGNDLEVFSGSFGS